MASGDVLVEILSVTPPDANEAIPLVISGGSTPGELVQGWSFDGVTTDNYIDFVCRLIDNAGTPGLTFKYKFSMGTASSGNVRIGMAIRRIADDAEDFDTSHTYSFNEATEAVPTAIGEVAYASIAFTNGADMDSLAAGELFILRFRREASDTTNDTASGVLELWGISGTET